MIISGTSVALRGKERGLWMIVHLKKGGDDAASRVYSLPWNDLQKSEEKGKRE